MKPALDLLREIRARRGDMEASAPPGRLESDRISETRGKIAPVCVQSPLHDEIRVALDLSSLTRLLEEEKAQERPGPVLTLDDVARLWGKSPEAVQAVLRVAAVFPGAKVIR